MPGLTPNQIPGRGANSAEQRMNDFNQGLNRLNQQTQALGNQSFLTGNSFSTKSGSVQPSPFQGNQSIFGGTRQQNTGVGGSVAPAQAGGVPLQPSPNSNQAVRGLGRQAGSLRFQPNQVTGTRQIDQDIRDAIARLEGLRSGVNVNSSEDPRLAALIERFTSGTAATQQSIADALAGLQEGAEGEAGIRETIGKLARGEGVGPIDVQSDPEAAAFRVARERENRRGRSQLAERATATGDINTGAFDVALADASNRAGFDIASNEARLANQRRKEVLQQMLSGAQLGLSDIGQQRATQARALSSLEGQLSQGSQNLFNAFQQAQADRQRQIQEGLAEQDLKFTGAGNALQALLGQRNSLIDEFRAEEGSRQFGSDRERQAIIDQLSTEQGLLGREDAQDQQAFQNELSRLGLDSSLTGQGLSQEQQRLQNEQFRRALRPQGVAAKQGGGLRFGPR